MTIVTQPDPTAAGPLSLRNSGPDLTDASLMTQSVRRLWSAWMSGNRGALDVILAEQPAILGQPEELADLVYAEYWLRKQIDNTVSDQEYLDRFPQIANILRQQFVIRKELQQLELEMESAATIVDDRGETPKHEEAWSRELAVSEAMVPEGFEPLALLGVGGMGVVIQARQSKLNRLVAVKSLKAGSYGTDRDRARLRKEARVVAQLKHPNIVQIYDVIEEQGRLFLIMECVQGSTLAQRTTPHPLPHLRAAEVTLAIADAIGAAHAAGFLHRDIKPSNVLLDESNNIKVTDFGLARASLDETVSLAGDLIGTPAYMSPEQIRGIDSEVDARTDIYSIGATLYQLLTGRPPFVGSSPAETLQQILHAEPQEPSALVQSVPRDLESICLKCLEKESQNRYHSVAALRDDLHAFQQGRPTKARPVSKFEKSRRWVIKNPTLSLAWAVGFASLLLLIVASTWYLTNIADLKLVSRLRDVALSQSRQREQLNAYYALAASIQARCSEKKIGWTWQNIQDIKQAVAQVPDDTEKNRLRQFLLQSLTSFDVRQSKVAINDMDPFGLAWSPTGDCMAIGENLTRSVLSGASMIVVHVLGREPLRPAREILLPSLEIESPSKGPEGVRSLVFLDDQRLAVGCRSGWIQIVDIDSGVSLAQLHGHNDWCYGMTFDAAHHWLISCSRDHTIAIWDSQNYARIADATVEGSVRHVTVLDNQLLAMGESLHCFTLPELKALPDPSWKSIHLQNIRALPGAKSAIVAGTETSFVVNSDSPSTREITLRRKHSDRTASYHHIDFSADGRWSSISGVNSVRFIDMLRSEETYTLPIPGAGAKYSTFDPHQPALWVTNNKQLLQYDLRLPAAWQHLTIPSVQLIRSDLSTDELQPHSGSKSTAIHTHHSASAAKDRILIHGVPPNQTQIEHAFQRTPLELKDRFENSDSHFRSTHWIWNCVTRELRDTSVPLTPQLAFYQTAFCLSTNGDRFWIADSDRVDGIDVRVGRLLVFDTATGRCEMSWMNRQSATSLRISGFEHIVCGDRKTVVISGDRIVRVFDSQSLELVCEIPLGGQAIPKVIALDRNETTAFVGIQDGRLLRVDLSSLEVSTVVAFDSEVTALTLSRLGVLAVGTSSGEVELWSVHGNAQNHLGQLTRREESIDMLEFSKDGNQLVLLVEGEVGCHKLDWSELRRLLADYKLDWSDEMFER